MFATFSVETTLTVPIRLEYNDLFNDFAKEETSIVQLQE